MRITIVLGPFLSTPPAPAGAIERRWTDIASEFAQLGHAVSIVCASHPDLPPAGQRSGVSFRYLKGYRQSGRLGIDLIKDMAYSAAAIRAIPPSDLVVVNAFWLPVFVPLLRRKATKVCYNVARMPKGQFWLYPAIDCFLAVSSAVRQRLGEEKPSLLRRTIVIPNPANTAAFVPPASARDFSGTKAILYTGRIHPEKGIELLIDAFRVLSEKRSDLELRIVGAWQTERGGGGQAYRDALQARAKGLNASFAEPIYDRGRFCNLMQQCHLYCYPSLAEKGETFGVAPLEAMATGLVPIVSGLECFRDFVHDGITGAVFDHRAADPAAELQRQMTRLLDHPSTMAQLSVAAAERARDFSNQKVATMYLMAFEQLLGSSEEAE